MDFVGLVVFVPWVVCVCGVVDFMPLVVLCLWCCGFCAVGLTSRFEVYKLDILTSRTRSQAWVIKQFSGIFLLQEFGIFDLGLVG